MAVGEVGARHGQPLIERWAGVRWTLVPSRLPRNMTTHLTDVSCSTAGACIAVGAVRMPHRRRVPVAMQWNGLRWSIQRTPRLQGFGFTGVSCVAAGSCMAVADGSRALGRCHTAFERWDGRRWHLLRSVRGPCDHLSSVSCASAASCAAVGEDDLVCRGLDDTEFAIPLAGRWNGSTWTLQRTPAVDCDLRFKPQLGEERLWAVDCASTSACVAVGVDWNADAPVAQHWSSREWSGDRMRLRPRLGELMDVSCPSPDHCFAVGYQFHEHQTEDEDIVSDDYPLIERRG